MTRTQKLIIAGMSVLVFCVFCLVLAALVNQFSPPRASNTSVSQATVNLSTPTNIPAPTDAPTALPSPTNIPPTATSSPPPTETQRPNTATPPSPEPSGKGTGLTRSKLVKTFEALGFSFKDGAPVDGEPSYLGMQPNGTVLLSMIGPADNLTRVIMTVFVSADDENANTSAALNLLLLLNAVDPDWKEGGAWLSEGVKRANRGETVTITRDNLIAKIEIVQSLGAMMLTFESFESAP